MAQENQTQDSSLENQVYERMGKVFGEVIHPIDKINEILILYVSNNGEVYKNKQYGWEETRKIDFGNKKLEVVITGKKINPSEIYEDSKKMGELVSTPQIGEVTPFEIHTEDGVIIRDGVMSI